jgi:hypothetical protein
MPAWTRLPLTATMMVTTPRVGTGQTWKVTTGFLGMASRVETCQLAR